MVVNLVNARESYNWSYYVGPRKLNTLRLAVTFHCVFFFRFSIGDNIYKRSLTNLWCLQYN